MPSAFAKRLANTAKRQYDLYRFYSEDDDRLSKQIRNYWADLNFGFPGVGTPWSAVFVSWCVKKAGAKKSEFTFSPAHSVFVYDAIQNGLNQTGLFRAFPIDEHAPSLGDIIHNNRGGSTHSFNYARTHKNYPSHSAIVIDVGVDGQGGYAMTIGGNESDSVRRKVVRLDSKGRIKQRKSSPYICVIQNLK